MGGWASDMLARRRSAQDEDGFKPWTGPETIPYSDEDRDQVNGTLRTDVMDAGRGFAQGALMGGADELVGAVGGDRELARQQWHESQARSPWLTGSMQALGGAPAAMAAGGWKGAMALGGLSGVLGGDPRDAGEAAQAFAGGAAAGGALHGMGEGMGMTSQLAGAASRGLGNIANDARNVALGGTGGDFQKAARMRGLDYIDTELPQSAEKLGLTNRFMPQSPGQYARKADAVRETAGKAEGAALDEAGQNVATYTPVDDLAEGLRRRGGASRDGTIEGVAEDTRLGQMADTLLSERGTPAMKRAPELDSNDMLYGGGTEVLEPGPEFIPTGGIAPGSAGLMSPRELNTQKSAYYDRGYKQSGMSDETAQLGATANREAGSEARDQLLAALDYAPEGVKPRYEQAAKTYGEAATIGDMTRNRAAANKAPTQGQGFFGTMMSPATKLAKDYGPDLAANVSRLGERAAGGVERMTGAAAPYGRAAGGAAFQPGAQLAGQLSSGSDEVPQGAAEAALIDLHTGGQALGQYQAEFAKAASSPDKGAVSTLITRLTMTDPQFRANVLPRLGM